MTWNEKKAQKIVNQHKQRFSLRLTLKIIRVLLAVFLLYAGYMITISLIYEYSHTGAKTEFYQKLAIDWTDPIHSSGWSENHREITPFLTQKLTISLDKRIGKENYTVGQLDLSKPIFTTFTQIKMKKNYPHMTNEHGFEFSLPTHPETDEQTKRYDNEAVWNTLENIHKGNVANMAFSTTTYYSPREIIDLISHLDLDVLWIPIYMGELESFTENWSSADDRVSLHPQFGLSGARRMTDDYRDQSLVTVLDQETITESQESMLNHMQTMLKDNKKLAETLLQTDHLQDRYDYISEYDFQAFGAVITGPVKELLKLKEIDSIHNVQLDEITHWNWE